MSSKNHSFDFWQWKKILSIPQHEKWMMKFSWLGIVYTKGKTSFFGINERHRYRTSFGLEWCQCKIYFTVLILFGIKKNHFPPPQKKNKKIDLVFYKFEVNAIDRFGFTPLYEALQRGNKDVCNPYNLFIFKMEYQKRFDSTIWSFWHLMPDIKEIYIQSHIIFFMKLSTLSLFFFFFFVEIVL